MERVLEEASTVRGWEEALGAEHIQTVPGCFLSEMNGEGPEEGHFLLIPAAALTRMREGDLEGGRMNLGCLP